MRARRGPDSSRIEDALAALKQALSDARAPWMVIGGIAVIAHGVQRMTTDIDAVIAGDAVPIDVLIAALKRHKIVPRIEGAAAFAAANLVLLTRHRPTGVDLDLSFGWTAFERDALAERKSTRYGRVLAPMASVEALLVFKAIAGRSRDVDDAITLLTLYPLVDVKRVRKRVAELAQLADAPELTRGLEQIIRAAAGEDRLPRSKRQTSPDERRASSKARKKRVAKRAPRKDSTR